MRGYLALTPDELAQLVNDGELTIETAYVQTSHFKAANPDLGEEESEYILSLLAADDSLAFQGDSAKFTFALAIDLEAAQIGEEAEFEVGLKSPIKFSQTDCLFVGEAGSDEGELTWYAAQEIANEIKHWIGK